MAQKDEGEVYALETVKKYTDTSHFLTLHTAKTTDFDSALGIYRTEKKTRIFSAGKTDPGLSQPRPGVLYPYHDALYSEFDLKRVSIDKLSGSQKVLAISFNDRLEPLDIPKATERFIKRHFPSTGHGFFDRQ